MKSAYTGKGGGMVDEMKRINLTAGILNQPLCHEEVTGTANRVKEQFKGLVAGVIVKI